MWLSVVGVPIMTLKTIVVECKERYLHDLMYKFIDNNHTFSIKQLLSSAIKS